MAALSDRPARYCDVCGKTDDHPRHVAKGRMRHLDCCAAQGCPTCTATEVETGGRRGKKLIDHLAAERANEGRV